jgi:hypothetical protein
MVQLLQTGEIYMIDDENKKQKINNLDIDKGSVLLFLKAESWEEMLSLFPKSVREDIDVLTIIQSKTGENNKIDPNKISEKNEKIKINNCDIDKKSALLFLSAEDLVELLSLFPESVREDLDVLAKLLRRYFKVGKQYKIIDSPQVTHQEWKGYFLNHEVLETVIDEEEKYHYAHRVYFPTDKIKKLLNMVSNKNREYLIRIIKEEYKVYKQWD